MTKEERVSKFKEENCAYCRYRGWDCKIPDNVMQPVKSKDAWIPGRVGCSKFRWS